MSDFRTLTVIAILGIASYAMRAGGYLVASSFPANGALARFFRLAPGNFFIAFVSAGCLEGGWASLAGSIVALTTMAVTAREWAAIGAGFAAALVATAILRAV
jgi:uncharacterized membrane protein